MKKLLLVLAALALIASPAMAGNQPEYDAVGCDATNFFNDFIKVAVCEKGEVRLVSGYWVDINSYSDWTRVPGQLDDGEEFFFTTAGMLLPDTCFSYICGGREYGSALVDPWNEAVFQWQIVLQKKPESDIDLNIRDCVTKHNEWCIWEDAEQTGRYRAPWGELIFVPSANPSVTVEAFPGPFATPSFEFPFIMDARKIPGLCQVALQDALFTSKALWEESIVMELPATGECNELGQATYNLHQGDRLLVTITIPPNNTVDLRYGPDNVILKYIGIVGTEYVDLKDTFQHPCFPEIVSPVVEDAFCGECLGCIPGINASTL